MTKTYTNNLGVEIADPNILFHEGIYYLYGTDEKRKSALGNPVYTSSDLVNWTEQELAFKKTDDTWGQRYFWGAEVIKKDDKFLMYYCCSPNEEDGEPLNMHLAAAIANSPLGPFTEVRAPMYAIEGKDEAIDQNVFVDEDAQAYLFFVKVVIETHNEIHVVKLKDNYLDIDGESIACILPDQEWESNEWDGHKVAEAPFVFKRGDFYYMLYTCNHFLDDKYAIGYATAQSPLGPWEKHDGNPILQMNDHVRGTGNACITKSPDGKESFIVYHTHNKPGQVAPRMVSIDRVTFTPSTNACADIMSIEGPTTSPKPIPSGG